MTTLVSLLFIAMIPIDCKITNFSLYLFFGSHYNIGEFISTTSKDKMIMNIIFAGVTPIN